VAEPPPPAVLVPDNVRSVLAYVVVIGLLAFIVAATFMLGIESGLKVAAFASGTIGTVVGFYFGRQGFDRVLSQAKAAEDNSTRESAKYTVADEEAAQLRGELTNLQAKYEELAGEYADFVREQEAAPSRKSEKP
jgi:hypothetical protein